MNREERRAAVKQLVKKGVPKESAETFVKRMSSITLNPTTTWEGEQVMLDYNRIITYPDWKIQRKDYKDWVTENKDKIFTVEFDPIKKERHSNDYNTLVQLKEDETKPKWLFWAGDLIPVEGQEKPKTDTDYENYMAKVDNIIADLRGK